MKNSISKQFAAIYILLLALTIGICIFLNAVMLPVYYRNEKIHTIKKSFEQLDQLMEEYDVDSEEYDVEFFHICGQNDIDTVMVNSSFEIVKSSIWKDKRVLNRLASYVFKGDPNFEEDEERPNKITKKEIDRADNYVINLSTDSFMNSDFIELWGTLKNGDMVIMRSPVENLTKNAKISNRFLMYVGFVAVIAGGFLVWFVSLRITRPILELSEISRKMKELDFNAKYEGKSTNEIGELGRHMNAMSSALEQTISELKSANLKLMGDLEQRMKLDEMRRDFIADVSHELKTPIALIRGYAEGLKEGITDDPENMDYYCDVITDEAEKMNGLVMNLLTLNQLEGAEQELNFERFDIMNLICSMVDASDILVKDKKATIEVIGEDSSYVWGDELRVEEVLNNYLSNAIHYVSQDGKIIIRTERLEDKIRTSVFNTGNPIPEESINRIWDKFYKVDKARTREYGGSGVGLSIVKAILESMHQDYGVENLENGVRFWFELDCK